MDQKTGFRFPYFTATSLRITLLYLFAGYSWILLSDRLIAFLVPDPNLFLILQTIKGWAYVTVTGLFLYLLVRSALRQQNASVSRFHTILNAIDDVFWYADAQGKVLYINDAVESVFGRSPTEFLSQPSLWLDVVHPQDRDDVATHQQKLREQGYLDAEYRILHTDGQERWVKDRKLVIYGDNGKPVQIGGICTDVTASKVAQQKLARSEANLRAIFENTLQAFLLVDRQQRVQAFNQVANKLARGVLHRDMEAGIHIGEIFTEEFYQNFQARFDKVIQGETITTQTSARDPNGEERWFEVNYNPVQTETGEIVGLSLSVMDITRRKVVEQERELLIKELESRNAELKRFNYTISHDLRSPLISIKGVLGLLEADIAAADEAQIATDLADIRRAADEMEKLLDDLLKLSRIGQTKQSLTAVAMSDLAQRAVNMLRGQIAARRVNVTIAPDMPVIMGEEIQLLEVWQNLIENAVKFIGDEPSPHITIGVKQTTPSPTFFVQDNGVGISPKYQKKIFNLFERIDTLDGGTGIGLAIVSRIIDTHNGKVWVESTPGRGSTFYFTLPQEGDVRNEATTEH